jgi:hypothetical protein
MDKAASLPPDQAWELNEIRDLVDKQRADEAQGRVWEFDVEARLHKIAQKLAAGKMNVKKDLSYTLRNGYRADPEAKEASFQGGRVDASRLKLKEPNPLARKVKPKNEMAPENSVAGEQQHVRK